MSIPNIADFNYMIEDSVRAYETDDIVYINDFSTLDETIDVSRYSIFRQVSRT